MHNDRTASTETTYLVSLWGPHHDMSCAEVAAVTRAPATLLVPGLVHAATSDLEPLLRLSHARAILRCLGRSTDLVPPFDAELVVRGTYCVRVHRLGVDEVIPERDVARNVWHRLREPRVDLVHPDTEIDVFATPVGLWWGVLRHAFDQVAFDGRRPRGRPFWRSTALGVRRARCLVNLSGVRPGGSLLDPFCGTGSILIEAALLGVGAFGSEIDATVCAGAARNLGHAGLRAELRHQDAREWRGARPRFDAIVTDLPYGHSASLVGEGRGELYGTFFEVAADVLADRGRMVLMCRQGTLPLPFPGLVVLHRFHEVVHGSLTREVLVLAKAGADRPR